MFVYGIPRYARLLRVLLALLLACNHGVVPAARAQQGQGAAGITLADLAQSSDQFSIFTKAMKLVTPELFEALAVTGTSYTVFAPTDAAFGMHTTRLLTSAKDEELCMHPQLEMMLYQHVSIPKVRNIATHHLLPQTPRQRADGGKL